MIRVRTVTLACTIGLFVSVGGAASAAHAQAAPALAPLALPEQLVMMCRAVSAEELDMADEPVVAREFVFTQPTSAAIGASSALSPQRTIAVVFDTSGTFVMLSDRYRDAEMGIGRMIGRLETGALMGSTTSIRLADVRAGNGLDGVPESVLLTVKDSGQAERLADWLWQRRCGRSGAAVR